MASNAKNLAELLNTDSTVAVGDIADGSISTAKLADDAVTNAKIGANAVGTTEIADDAVTSAKSDGSLGIGKNVVINGAMQVSQRSTSEAALGNGSTDIVRTVDRIKFSHDSTSGRITMSQNSPTDLPGFTKSVKLQVTTALSSPAAGNYIQLKYTIEGQDLQHFAKGTSSAKVMALSFYVKGNGNATYMCELEDHDNGRNNQQQFSVTSSWNRVQLLYAGDTTGTFGNDANLSMSIIFWLVAGSTYSGGSYTANTWASPTTNKRAAGISNLYSSTSNFIEITGLKLEPVQVTDFEHRSFAEELLLCQRYFHNVTAAGHPFPVDNAYARYITHAQDANGTKWFYEYPVEMRASPTLTLNNISSSTVQHFNYNAQTGYAMTGASLAEIGKRHAHISFTFASGISAGNTVSWRWNNVPNASWDFSSEL